MKFIHSGHGYVYMYCSTHPLKYRSNQSLSEKMYKIACKSMKMKSNGNDIEMFSVFISIIFCEYSFTLPCQGCSKEIFLTLSHIYIMGGVTTKRTLRHATSKDSDELAHLHSLNRVFTKSMKNLQGVCYPQSVKGTFTLSCKDVQGQLNVGRWCLSKGLFWPIYLSNCEDRQGYLLWNYLFTLSQTGSYCKCASHDWQATQNFFYCLKKKKKKSNCHLLPL